jgi:hypothetical protein
VSIKDSVDKTLPDLQRMDREVHRLAINIEVKLGALFELVLAADQQGQIDVLTRLRETVQSAARVLSSASTAFRETWGTSSAIDAQSNFEDLFPNQNNEQVSQWVQSQPSMAMSSLNSDEAVPRREVEGNNSRNSGETVFYDAVATLESSPSTQIFSTIPLALSRESSREGESTRAGTKSSITSTNQPPPGSTNASTPSIVMSNSPNQPVKTKWRGYWKRPKKESLATEIPNKVDYMATFDDYIRSIETNFWRMSAEARQKHIDRLKAQHETALKYYPKMHWDKTLGSYNVKFVIVGDGAVGKTVLLMYAASN